VFFAQLEFMKTDFTYFLTIILVKGSRTIYKLTGVMVRIFKMQLRLPGENLQNPSSWRW
jgi:hypothetical protein